MQVSLLNTRRTPCLQQQDNVLEAQTFSLMKTFYFQSVLYVSVAR